MNEPPGDLGLPPEEQTYYGPVPADPPTGQTPLSPTEAPAEEANAAAAEPTPTFGPDFNPDTVPGFPVLTTEITAPPADGKPWQVSVDGLPVPGITARTEEAAADAAIAAIAAHIAGRGWTACRVTALSPSPESPQPRSHRLIIGAEGEVYDLDTAPPPSARSHTTTSRRTLILGGLGGALALAGLGTGVGLGLARLRTPPPAPAPPPPITAQPVELAGQPPATLSPQAAWASPPIAEDRCALLPDGTIAVLAPRKRELLILDPRHGQPIRTIEAGGTITAGPWATTLAPAALVWRCDSTLHWLTVTDLGAKPQTYKLPEGSKLVTLPEGLAWRTGPTEVRTLNAQIGPQTRTTAADTAIIGLTDGAVWLTDRLGRSHRSTSASSTAEPPLQLPAPANTQPRGLLHASPAGVLAAWAAPTGSTTYTIHSPDTTPNVPARGTVTLPQPITTSLDTNRDDAPPVDRPWVAVRGGAINLATGTHVPLPDATVQAILGDTAWTTRDNASTATTLTTGKTVTERRPAEVLKPLARSGDHILVATKDRLYALNTT